MNTVLLDIASRLARLKTSSGAETTPLTFAVGAVFAFLKAEELNFRFGNEPGRALGIWPEASQVCDSIAKGNPLPTRGDWLAGYYYNDCLIRLAVAFEHLVRHETGLHGYERLEEMKLEACRKGFHSEWLKSWGDVHNELSTIRHKNKEFDGPEVNPKRAIEVLTHLTDALEWACEKRAQR